MIISSQIIYVSKEQKLPNLSIITRGHVVVDKTDNIDRTKSMVLGPSVEFQRILRRFSDILMSRS